MQYINNIYIYIYISLGRLQWNILSESLWWDTGVIQMDPIYIGLFHHLPSFTQVEGASYISINIVVAVICPMP